VGSRTGSGAEATEAGTGRVTDLVADVCAGTATGAGRFADRFAVERATGARGGFGVGTVMATSTPRATAATTTTAIPGPELVCDSSSMASVEKMTVQEPYVSCATVGRGMAIVSSGAGAVSTLFGCMPERNQR